MTMGLGDFVAAGRVFAKIERVDLVMKKVWV